MTTEPALRHKVLRIKNTAQVEQERVVVEYGPGWVARPAGNVGRFFPRTVRRAERQ